MLIASPVPSGGEFPNTIAYSAALQRACVANTGAKADVQCYAVSDAGLEPKVM